MGTCGRTCRFASWLAPDSNAAAWFRPVVLGAERRDVRVLSPSRQDYQQRSALDSSYRQATRRPDGPTNGPARPLRRLDRPDVSMPSPKPVTGPSASSSRCAGSTPRNPRVGAAEFNTDLPGREIASKQPPTANAVVAHGRGEVQRSVQQQPASPGTAVLRRALPGNDWAAPNAGCCRSEKRKVGGSRPPLTTPFRECPLLLPPYPER
jgi:hypothetical protein